MINAVETRSPSELDFSVRGSTGLKQMGGVVSEEFLPPLIGRRAVLTYREMRDNSSTIGAIAYAIESLIRQVEWRIEAGGDTPEHLEWAEFVEGCLEDMSHTFEDFLIEVLSMLTYGWTYHEIVYKVRRGPEATSALYRSKFKDGKIGWRKLPIRSQDTLDRWEFDPDDNGVRGLWQFDPYALKGATLYVPIEKALLFRTSGHKNNPEGRSIYRNAVTDYYSYKRILDIERVGIERDMTGLLTMEVPIDLLKTTAGPAEVALRAELERMLSALKRDEREFAIIPPEMDSDNKPTGYKLKLLSSGGSRQTDTSKVLTRIADSMLTTTLTDFLRLGQGTVGSFALASSKTKLFSFSLGAVMDSMAAVFNRFAIPRLMKANGVPQDLHPYLVHGDIEAPPLEEVAGYITALAGAGVLSPSKQLERKLLEIGRLPVPPVDTEEEPLPGEVSHAHPTNAEDETPEIAARFAETFEPNGRID